MFDIILLLDFIDSPVQYPFELSQSDQVLSKQAACEAEARGSQAREQNRWATVPSLYSSMIFYDLVNIYIYIYVLYAHHMQIYIYICLHDHGIMVFVKLIFAHGVAIKKCEHVKLESSAANEAIALLRQEYAEQRQLLLSEAGAEVQALRSEVQNLKCGNPNENAGTMAW